MLPATLPQVEYRTGEVTDPTFGTNAILTWNTAVKRTLTAIIERDGNGYVSLCHGLDIASQGDSVELARENLREALELFFETAPPEEVARRLSGEVFVTQVEVICG